MSDITDEMIEAGARAAYEKEVAGTSPSKGGRPFRWREGDGPAARALRRRMGDQSSDSVDDVVDTVWDVLNDRTNHGTTPYSYDDVAAAVRDALAGKQVSDG